MTTREHIKMTLNKVMDEKCIQGSDLAKALGVSGASVRRWRIGDCVPDVDLIPKLCSCLGVTINELTGMPSEKMTSEQISLARTYDGNSSLKELIDAYLSNGDFKSLCDSAVALSKKRG